MLELLDRSTPAAIPARLAEQLATITTLIAFFDHVATTIPTRYPTLDPN